MPELLEVHVTPSGEVTIVPASPTATKVQFPKVIPLRAYHWGRGFLQCAVPSWSALDRQGKSEIRTSAEMKRKENVLLGMAASSGKGFVSGPQPVFVNAHEPKHRLLMNNTMYHCGFPEMPEDGSEYHESAAMAFVEAFRPTRGCSIGSRVRPKTH
ncbi:MAG: hypothetical protein MZU91_05300 [Desulfosudis oleivorans]|nr:hypothetical protein [Desulfosudis oleivorans]